MEALMKEILLGNEAIARGAYESGVKVCSSYPGTPSTEITETVARMFPSIYSEWASNEKVGFEVALGASFAGARAMTCMKHVGLNVAADPLFTSVYTGVRAGLVFVVADDPGMHSSQNEQDSRNYARAAKFPMLEPSDSQECKDFVKIAFELSERFDTPVGVRLTTRVAHSRAPVTICDPVRIEQKPYLKDMQKYVMMPAMAIKRHPVVEQRMVRFSSLSAKDLLYQYDPGHNEVGIITTGICYQYVKEACPETSVLKLGVIWPINIDLVREFAGKVKKLIVVEELDPFIENCLKAHQIACEGKNRFTLLGEYSVQMLRQTLHSDADENHHSNDGVMATIPKNLPIRPPVMCAGCSHKGIFMALKRLGAIVTGDIGCYTLGALPPISAMDTCVCMGASVGMAHGFDKGSDHRLASKTVAVIGDSTFLHTGINGLINSVYNKSRSTILILDNSITGMTGHQQNPSSGLDIRCETAPQINIKGLCESLGVPSVRVVDPADTYIAEKVINEEMNRECLSVIIAQRPCAIIPQGRGDKYIKAIVNETLCKKCGLCLKCMCPALTEGADRKIVIDLDLCNGCGLCEKLCKLGALTMGDIR
jgi:indolepyruvate ferredoxin oxidoreductase, alpha subunit